MYADIAIGACIHADMHVHRQGTRRHMGHVTTQSQRSKSNRHVTQEAVCLLVRRRRSLVVAGGVPLPRVITPASVELIDY